MKAPLQQVLIWAADELQARYLEQVYANAGFAVRICQGYHALRQATLELGAEPLALVLSLSRQPDITYKHLRQLHRQFPLAALLVISPYQDPGLNQAAVEAGADDCLIQPVEAAELIGRTRARLRRAQTLLQMAQRYPPPDAPPALQWGPLKLEPGLRQVQLGGQTIKLTRSEFALLLLLAEQANQRLSRNWLHQQLWQCAEVPGSRRLDNFVLNLRKKLPASPDWELLTFYGEGFCLKLKG